MVFQHTENVEPYGSEIIYALKFWLWIVKLDLADEKTEADLIISRRKNSTSKIRNDYQQVVLKIGTTLLGAGVYVTS